MTEWVAEFAIEESLACALIEAQFPNFAPARLELLGAGWDNTAFLVNGNTVFRFPRRQIAVPLLETERRLLPWLAPRLPLAIPTPEFHGRPTPEFPWPFAGYRFLPGRTASSAALDDSQRSRAAEPVAHFLRALHSVPTHDVAPLGVGPDTLGRLEVPRRAARARQRLEGLVKMDLVSNAERVFEMLGAAPDPPLPGLPKLLVHGDLYAAHLLVDADGTPCGVIDWGDVHLGHPALDLALVFGFFQPQGRRAFERVYGEIDGETRALARFKALEVAVALLGYGQDVGKPDLIAEAQGALRHLVLEE